MSSLLDLAKANLDEELDAAETEIIKRWKVLYDKGQRAARLKALIEIVKGGIGSGNWAHRGRPGKRGGSTLGYSGGMAKFAITPALRALYKGQEKYDGNGRALAAKIFNELGYDAKPQIVTNLDDAIATGDSELFRGISGSDAAKTVEQVDNFKRGDLFVGDGIYGSGTYTAYGFDGKQVASSYANKKSEGLIRMALDNNAKVVTISKLKNDMYELQKASETKRNAIIKAALNAHKRGDVELTNKLLQASSKVNSWMDDLAKAMNGDYAVAAAAMGYDAINVDDQRYMIVLNRGKVKVEP